VMVGAEGVVCCHDVKTIKPHGSDSLTTH
jgi:hypothetical protein